MNIGKQVAGNVYIHRDSIGSYEESWFSEVYAKALKVIGEGTPVDYDVVKINKHSHRAWLLSYPRFFEDPFPALEHSCRINISTHEVTNTSFAHYVDPPIIHRKELMLAFDHPKRALFTRLTKDLDAIGVFKVSGSIGNKNVWNKRLVEADVSIINHTLLLGGITSMDNTGENRMVLKLSGCLPLDRGELITMMGSTFTNTYDERYFYYECEHGFLWVVPNAKLFVNVLGENSAFVHILQLGYKNRHRVLNVDSGSVIESYVQEN